jgi:malate dehydrogenase
MHTVAIIGAGELGGAVAHALATRDRVGRILLVDAAETAAAGKALDIQQTGAVDEFHTRVAGTGDQTRITGCSACVVADRFGKAPAEWQGDEAVTMVARLVPYLADAPVLFAGAAQAGALLGTVRDGGISRRRVLGSAPEAYRSAVAAIIALEARCSPREIALTVLGAPGRFVVPWSEASIGGHALERVLTPLQLTRIEARLGKLWPPGAYTLGLAAARVVEAILESSRQTFSVLSVLSGEFGVKDGVGALPVWLASHGIAQTRVPSLSTRERVLLGSSLGA